VVRLFSKVWKIKFSNIQLVAILVNGLSRYHSDFSIAIVDSIVEAIKVGLEQNNFRHNQKRIAIVRFLGELYNYRMVDSPLIFSTLDTLISAGHGKDTVHFYKKEMDIEVEMPIVSNEFPPPTHFSRRTRRGVARSTFSHRFTY